ncbi:MAG: sugar porter family MFS transporter [Phycisphaerales bacterium]|nr:sugar porter family MFS transporter [Phycisphaerales bacterium]
MPEPRIGPSFLVSFGVGFMAAVGGFLFGYDIGVISGALLSIREQFGVSDFLSELITAGVLIGAILGAAAGGWMADRYGRRFSNMAAGIIFGVGAIFLAFVPDPLWLVVGRVVIGVGVGLASVVGPLYISETSPPATRGSRVSLFQLAIVLGILSAYVVDAIFAGSTDGWRWMFGLGAVPGFFLFAGFIFMPCSPRWLIMQGRLEEARSVQQQLVEPEEVDACLQRITSDIDKGKKGTRTPLMSVPGIRLGLAVALGLAVLQQFIGINTILFYAPIHFQHAGLKSDSAALAATVGLGIVNMLATLIALRYVDRAGRRPLLICGTVGMTISLAVMAVGFAFMTMPQPDTTAVAKAPHAVHTPSAATHYLGTTASDTKAETKDTTATTTEPDATTADADAISPLCIVILVFTAIFVACFAFSLGPITWTMIAEIFPNEVRDRCVAMAASVNWASNFVISLTFLSLLADLGPSMTFALYGLVGLVGVIWIWKVVPETKGYTLEEIEENLARGDRTKWLPPASSTSSPAGD